MDSLTQLVLGGAVGAAVLGRRIGPRRAALVGGVLGTLPDLDVFIPFSDPIDAFVLHRGATHSLLIQALATPILGEALRHLVRDLRAHRWLAYLAVYLCLSTHALLDGITVYGTRFLWPLWPEPFGVGSVFIIDPLYTLPLLVAMVWALASRHWTRHFRRGLAACLVLSTAYLGWSLVVQRIAEARAETLLAEAGVRPERVLATPTPFNTLFWRVIAVDGERYLNLYVPLLAGRDAVTVYAHPRADLPERCLDAVPAIARLAAFSKGFYRVDRAGDEVAIADLRMGLTSSYAFRFIVAAFGDAGLAPVPARRQASQRRAGGDLEWLLAGIRGEPAVRPSEASALVSGPPAPAGPETAGAGCPPRSGPS